MSNRRRNPLSLNMGSSRFASPGRTDFLVLYSVVVYKHGRSQFTICYKSTNNVVYSCKYHVVWCPK